MSWHIRGKIHSYFFCKSYLEHIISFYYNKRKLFRNGFSKCQNEYRLKLKLKKSREKGFKMSSHYQGLLLYYFQQITMTFNGTLTITESNRIAHLYLGSTSCMIMAKNVPFSMMFGL